MLYELNKRFRLFNNLHGNTEALKYPTNVISQLSYKPRV